MRVTLAISERQIDIAGSVANLPGKSCERVGLDRFHPERVPGSRHVASHRLRGSFASIVRLRSWCLILRITLRAHWVIPIFRIRSISCTATDNAPLLILYLSPRIIALDHQSGISAADLEPIPPSLRIYRDGSQACASALFTFRVKPLIHRMGL